MSDNIIRRAMNETARRTQAAGAAKAQKAAVSIEQPAQDSRSLQRTAIDQLKKSVFGSENKEQHLAILRTLINTNGDRKEAYQALKISDNSFSVYMKDIRSLPDKVLQTYADELGIEKQQIKNLCSKGNVVMHHIKILQALYLAQGDRASAAKALGIKENALIGHVKIIRESETGQLQIYADALGITAEQVKDLCAKKPKGREVNVEQRKRVIQVLINVNGDRIKASKILRMNQVALSGHIKKIRDLSNEDLQTYANELGVTLQQIKNICKKGNTASRHIKILHALILTNGDHAEAAEILGKNSIENHIKSIQAFPDEQLQILYADELGITVKQIKYLCISKPFGKGVHGQFKKRVIRALIQSGGDRVKTAKKLGIGDAALCTIAKLIRGLPDENLQKCADELGITVQQIKIICSEGNLAPRQLKILRTLIFTKGDRTAAANILGKSSISNHLKNIRDLSREQLQIYADELGITVEHIENLCAPVLPAAKKKLFPSKATIEQRKQTIRALIESDGNITNASKILKITREALTERIKRIKGSSPAEMQICADGLRITVKQIEMICDKKSGVLYHIKILRALVLAKGNWTNAAKTLSINDKAFAKNIKNILSMSAEQLQTYADELSITAKHLKALCVSPATRNDAYRIKTIRALIQSGGKRTEAANRLGIPPSTVSAKAKKISRLPDAQLKKYAAALKTTLKNIKAVCAPKWEIKSSQKTLRADGKKLGGGFKKPEFKAVGEGKMRVKLPKRLKMLKARVFIP